MADRDELNLSAAFDFARDTLKSLVLVNGGAVVALLAFYGGDNARAFTPGSFLGLMGFTLGVAAAVASSLAAYLAQFQFGKSNPDPKWGGRALNTAIALATVSLVLFIAGVVAIGLALGE